MAGDFVIRPSEDADSAAIAAIYGHHVLHGVASFEEVPPPVDLSLHPRRFDLHRPRRGRARHRPGLASGGPRPIYAIGLPADGRGDRRQRHGGVDPPSCRARLRPGRHAQRDRLQIRRLGRYRTDAEAARTRQHDAARSLRETTMAEITGYHAHIYYDPQSTRGAAADLREAIAAAFPQMRIGAWHDEPVGPHGVAMYQVVFAVED